MEYHAASLQQLSFLFGILIEEYLEFCTLEFSKTEGYDIVFVLMPSNSSG